MRISGGTRDRATGVESLARLKQYHAADILGMWTPANYQARARPRKIPVPADTLSQEPIEESPYPRPMEPPGRSSNSGRSLIGAAALLRTRAISTSHALRSTSPLLIRPNRPAVRRICKSSARRNISASVRTSRNWLTPGPRPDWFPAVPSSRIPTRPGCRSRSFVEPLCARPRPPPEQPVQRHAALLACTLALDCTRCAS